MFEGIKLTLSRKNLIGIAYDITCDEFAYLTTYLIKEKKIGYSYIKFNVSFFETYWDAKEFAKEQAYLPITHYIKENRKKQIQKKTKIYRYK